MTIEQLMENALAERRDARRGLAGQRAVDEITEHYAICDPKPPLCAACRDGDHETYLRPDEPCSCPCHGRPR